MGFASCKPADTLVSPRDCFLNHVCLDQAPFLFLTVDGVLLLSHDHLNWERFNASPGI